MLLTWPKIRPLCQCSIFPAWSLLTWRSLPALLCKTISNLRPNFCMHSCISSTGLLHCHETKVLFLSTFHSTYHQNSTSCLPQLWSEIGKNSTLTSKFKLACVSRKMRGYFFRKTKTKYSRGDIFHSEIVPLGENEPKGSFTLAFLLDENVDVFVRQTKVT